MEKSKPTFDDFLADVPPPQRDFACRTHEALTGAGCPMKIESAKSGFVVSYTHPANKRVILNFVFRKSGLVARVYADRHADYMEVLEALPDSMVKSIAKAPACKRLINPTACNGRCAMGYDFALRGQRHQKCRYNCFLLPVNEESEPHLAEMVDRELRARGALV